MNSSEPVLAAAPEAELAGSGSVIAGLDRARTPGGSEHANGQLRVQPPPTLPVRAADRPGSGAGRWAVLWSDLADSSPTSSSPAGEATVPAARRASPISALRIRRPLPD